MSADQKVNVDITANAAQANAEMNTFAQRAAAVGRILKEVFTGVQEGVTSLQTQTSSDLGKIGSAIEAVQKRFALWAAMLSGGAVAKEAINATVSFTKET
ncbi:MAG TPA: hypothetical protein PLN55_11535, partial [Burkholderiaceae bacterium]|nr:hypothetical protein [Burkholderiaceae bacterium]